MSDATTIEWTATRSPDGAMVTRGATLNVVTGGRGSPSREQYRHCEVSPGCDRCYARTFAERWRGTPGHPYEQGFDLRLWPERLELPLRWTRPRKVFVCSMAELFQPGVPDDFLLRLFEVMFIARHHTYLLLTKRPGRLVDTSLGRKLLALCERETGRRVIPRHIRMGTTIECQGYTDADGRTWDTRWRARTLCQVAAELRWVSAEPLLTGLDLEETLGPGRIAWVVAGAESGHGARPCREEWLRGLRDQCQRTGAAFFLKQVLDGRGHKVPTPLLDGVSWVQDPDDEAFRKEEQRP